MATGNANIADELKKGKQLGDRTYKVYLDGYNQVDLIAGKGRVSEDVAWAKLASMSAGARLASARLF